MAEPKLFAVNGSALPDPPYPPSRNRGLKFMLDHERIFQSDTWTLCPAELRGQLLLLWMQAWCSYPMGSLPQDDAVIAAKIGMSPVHFKAHRDVLMRGFRLCSDGRYYHPVVDEQVVYQLRYRERKSKNQSDYKQRLTEKMTGQRRSVTANDRELPVQIQIQNQIQNQKKEKDPPSLSNEREPPLGAVEKNPRKRFVAPKVEEVAAYCRERNNGIDAQQFVNFYEAKGWTIGKSPMKDWKAAVRTWEAKRAETAAQQPQPAAPNRPPLWRKPE